MKYNCDWFSDLAKEETIRLQDWHDYFAIIPRKVAPRDCRIFETIQRKGEQKMVQTFICGWTEELIWVWEYRAK